jgi:hypothetical protein
VNRREVLKLLVAAPVAVATAKVLPVPAVPTHAFGDSLIVFGESAVWEIAPREPARIIGSRGAWKRALGFQMNDLKAAFVDFESDPDLPRGTWAAW